MVDKPTAQDYFVAGLMGGPGGLDAVTRRGHAQMQHSERLPAKGLGEDGGREILSRAGVVFGKIDPRNKLFVEATLPTGWSIKPTDHYMYSTLRDQNDLVRAQIMYKATDNDAWISCRRRFSPSAHRDDYSDDKSPYIPVIEDSNNRQVWRGKAVGRKPGDHDKAVEIARRKIDEVAPLWESLDAYWLETPAFPEHETPVDTRQVYVLWVAFEQGGHPVDSGEHCRVKAVDDKEGVAKLQDALRHAKSHYDVRWSILCGDRVVDKGTFFQRKLSYNDYPSYMDRIQDRIDFDRGYG